MAIYLSTTGTAPFVPITEAEPKEDTATINETSDYTSQDIVSSIYLVLENETKSEIRLVVENDETVGSSLWISKPDQIGEPIKWEKVLIYTDLDTSQEQDDRIVILVKMKWATLNNIFLNKYLYYNSSIKIYEVT